MKWKKRENGEWIQFEKFRNRRYDFHILDLANFLLRLVPQNLFISSGLYYKPLTIVNDDSRVITKLETSLTDDARVVIYDRHMFIVQATGYFFHL